MYELSFVQEGEILNSWCKSWHFAVRLRVNSIFQNSKTSLLTWLRAICLVTQGKRGISALELQSDLGMKSYDTAWTLLHKIREALRQRDESYTLHNIVGRPLHSAPG